MSRTGASRSAVTEFCLAVRPVLLLIVGAIALTDTSPFWPLGSRTTARVSPLGSTPFPAISPASLIATGSTNVNPRSRQDLASSSRDHGPVFPKERMENRSVTIG